jgi:hypothetical protein
MAATMLMKVVVGVLAAPVLLAALRLLGANSSLHSPILLADLCGLFAIAALAVALFGPEARRKDEDGDARETGPISLSPAAQPPRWPNR